MAGNTGHPWKEEKIIWEKALRNNFSKFVRGISDPDDVVERLLSLEDSPFQMDHKDKIEVRFWKYSKCVKRGKKFQIVGA